MQSRNEKRRIRACRLGYAQSVPAGYVHILVPQDLETRARSQIKALVLHDKINRKVGRPFHYLSEAIEMQSKFLDPSITRYSRLVNRSAAAARHSWGGSEENEDNGTIPAGVGSSSSDVSGALGTESQRRQTLVLDSLIEQPTNLHEKFNGEVALGDGNSDDLALNFVFGRDDSEDEFPEDLPSTCPHVHDKEFIALDIGNGGIAEGKVKGPIDSAFRGLSTRTPMHAVGQFGHNFKDHYGDEFQLYDGVIDDSLLEQVHEPDKKKAVELQGFSIFIPLDSDSNGVTSGNCDLRWADVADSGTEAEEETLSDRHSDKDLHEDLHDKDSEAALGKEPDNDLHEDLHVKEDHMHEQGMNVLVNTRFRNHHNLEACITAPWRQRSRRRQPRVEEPHFDMTALDFHDDTSTDYVEPPGSFLSRPVANCFGIRNLLPIGAEDLQVESEDLHVNSVHDEDVLHDTLVGGEMHEDVKHDETMPASLHEQGFVYRLAVDGQLVECISPDALHTIVNFTLSHVYTCCVRSCVIRQLYDSQIDKLTASRDYWRATSEDWIQSHRRFAKHIECWKARAWVQLDKSKQLKEKADNLVTVNDKLVKELQLSRKQVNGLQNEVYFAQLFSSMSSERFAHEWHSKLAAIPLEADENAGHNSDSSYTLGILETLGDTTPRPSPLTRRAGRKKIVAIVQAHWASFARSLIPLEIPKIREKN